MSLRISSESSFPVAMSIFPGLEFVMETLAAAVLSPIVIPVTVAVPLTTTLKLSALIVPASTETTDAIWPVTSDGIDTVKLLKVAAAPSSISKRTFAEADLVTADWGG